jgi:hypothetical protein
MPTPWVPAVKNSKQLTVFAGPGLMRAPAWGGTLFKKVIDEFNRLSVVNKLKVTLVESKTPPDPDNDGGANVQIEVSVGTHTFTVEGKPQTGTLISGFDIVGKIHLVRTAGGETKRGFIFVPINPTIQGANSRGVGQGVKLALTLHEVLHACGLDESDPGHSSGLDNPDFFMTNSQLNANFPPDGNPGDRLFLGRNRFAPPISITARTAGLIQSNW